MCAEICCCLEHNIPQSKQASKQAARNVILVRYLFCTKSRFSPVVCLLDPWGLGHLVPGLIYLFIHGFDRLIVGETVPTYTYANVFLHRWMDDIAPFFYSGKDRFLIYGHQKKGQWKAGIAWQWTNGLVGGAELEKTKSPKYELLAKHGWRRLVKLYSIMLICSYHFCH